jgi:hypothetical protein
MDATYRRCALRNAMKGGDHGKARRQGHSGDGRGISEATAQLFRQDGTAVAILDRSDNAAKAVASEIGAVAVSCGVAGPASVAVAVSLTRGSLT